ncbi:MAG: carboxymuconolactone decarboxylase family protein [Bradyrhizobium sp.]|uniref:carboxymuconolactone decarboxylase family protein n=1 Tax=Bradyrhizobium sp. TaxID=376 RepID=UPI0025C292A5|nr:carboxymuconolactone decarboxylase family protein [Bradyrhizobium sp.]MBI5265314.1 carboxymuconolactone decarboxylase family protein [Bradyrhizobium sp.]
MQLDNRIRELIAIGTAIGANCHTCLEYHTKKARDQGVPEDEIAQAVEVGKSIRAGAHGSIDRLVNELMGERSAVRKQADSCCGAGTVEAATPG